MKVLNVGIIGFGLSGRYLQAPFFEYDTNFNLKTIVSTNQNVQATYPNVHIAKSIQAVLSDESIDLVSICTPNETHFEYAKETLLAGKHVMVEKPFTTTSKEAAYLIALAHEKRKIISVFQNRRFDSDFLTVQKIIADDLLGDIKTLEINFNRYKPTLNTKKWKEIPSPGSGIIYDLGSHIIDQSIALFGIPQKVFGRKYTERDQSIIDDAFEIELIYDNIKVILKASLLVQTETPRYIITGTKGCLRKYGLDVQEDQLKAGMLPSDVNFGIESNSQSGKITYKENELQTEKIINTEKGNWAMLFKNVYDAIVFGKDLLINPADVLEQIKIIESIKKI
jgi:scyllo-inositol 2-dehydrogenase (NADP+)